MADEAVLRIKVEDADANRAGPRGARPAEPGAATPAQPSAGKAAGAQQAKIFDPVAEAQKMRQLETARESVRAQYKTLYGETAIEERKRLAQQKKAAGRADSELEALADIFTSHRTRLGGAFGVLVGSVFDVVAALRQASRNASAGALGPALTPTALSALTRKPEVPTPVQPEAPKPVQEPEPVVPGGIPLVEPSQIQPAAPKPDIFEIGEQPIPLAGHVGPSAPGEPIQPPPPTLTQAEIDAARKKPSPVFGAATVEEYHRLKELQKFESAGLTSATPKPDLSPISIESVREQVLQRRRESPLGSMAREPAPEPEGLLGRPGRPLKQLIPRSHEVQAPETAPPEIFAPIGLPKFRDYTKTPEYVQPAAPQPATPSGPAMGIAFESDAAQAAPAAGEALGAVGEGAAVAGGAMAALGAAVPVVGAVLLGMKALGDVMTGTVQAASGFAGALLDADPAPAKLIDTLGQSYKKTADSIFLLSPTVSVLGSVVGETVSSFGKLLSVIDANASKFGEYNPQLAVAEAMGEVRQVMGDLRRAQEVGPQLARYVNARADFQQKFADIQTRLLEQILPAVTGGVKVLEKMLPLVEIGGKIFVATTPIIHILEFIDRWFGEQQANEIETATQDALAGYLRAGAPGSGVQVPQL
jgi:hypothetical protein